jgi:hypothetical protein
VKDFVGVDEFGVALQVIDSWQNFLIKPVLNLEIARKS